MFLPIIMIYKFEIRLNKIKMTLKIYLIALKHQGI